MISGVTLVGSTIYPDMACSQSECCGEMKTEYYSCQNWVVYHLRCGEKDDWEAQGISTDGLTCIAPYYSAAGASLYYCNTFIRSDGERIPTCKRRNTWSGGYEKVINGSELQALYDESIVFEGYKESTCTRQVCDESTCSFEPTPQPRKCPNVRIKSIPGVRIRYHCK